MISKLRNDEKGFTLIELMIVIAIIGILAAIAIPQFAAYRARSFNAAALADLRNLATSQEAYYADNMTYSADTGPIATGYGMSTSENVIISTAGTGTLYSITSYNSNGTKTYYLTGPGGLINDV
jgi:prepilin-type N-terminal cleavage/methylation domain-containing protein